MVGGGVVCLRVCRGVGLCWLTSCLGRTAQWSSICQKTERSCFLLREERCPCSHNCASGNQEVTLDSLQLASQLEHWSITLFSRWGVVIVLKTVKWVNLHLNVKLSHIIHMPTIHGLSQAHESSLSPPGATSPHTITSLRAKISFSWK